MCNVFTSITDVSAYYRQPKSEMFLLLGYEENAPTKI